MMWLGLFAACVASAASAQTADAPAVRANDSWTCQVTVENKTGWHQTRTESTVVHTGATSIALSSKPVGSTMPPTEALAGADWSRFRSVNGKETVVNRPFAFPLSTGKTWEVDYTEDNPNREHKREHIHHVYRVTGWEDVTVPAGTFHAIKVEAEGTWTAIIPAAIVAAGGTKVDAQGSTSVAQSARTRERTVSGRTYKAF